MEKEELLKIFDDMSERYKLGWGSDLEIRNLIISAWTSGYYTGKREAFAEQKGG